MFPLKGPQAHMQHPVACLHATSQCANNLRRSLLLTNEKQGCQAAAQPRRAGGSTAAVGRQRRASRRSSLRSPFLPPHTCTSLSQHHGGPGSAGAAGQAAAAEHRAREPCARRSDDLRRAGKIVTHPDGCLEAAGSTCEPVLAAPALLLGPVRRIVNHTPTHDR